MDIFVLKCTLLSLLLLSLPSDAAIIPADRTTIWNPGILDDTQQYLPLGDDRLPVRTTVYITLSPGDDINSAIKSCPAGQVVQLQPGTFTVVSTVSLKNGVVVRGPVRRVRPVRTTTGAPEASTCQARHTAG